ncbi:MAG TPA: hypothetical protein VF275_03465 [Gammaproteobacteria bacterium]
MNWNDIPNLKTPEAAAREWLATVTADGQFSYAVTTVQVAAFARLSDVEKFEWVAEARSFALRLHSGSPSDQV